MDKPTVSIQGHPGSFHDIARRRYFPNGHHLRCRDDFKDIFSDIHTDVADYAVVAIENSLYGSINQVYDLLLKHRFWIRGEIYLRIRHCLLAPPGGSIANIREVHSHPLAFAQCEEYLDEVLPRAVRFEHHDTAAGAADVATWGDAGKATIASQEAAELHGLDILDSGIETNHQNYTRFIVLQKSPGPDPEADKSSIILYTAHQPGALYRALGVFAEHRINLSKLESRPIVGRAWHYMFYIDLEAGLDESRTRQALEQLTDMGNDITELGSYQQSNIMPD